MKRYIEYYHLSTGWNGTDFNGPRKPIPMCGSDSVIPLDGRFSIRSCHEVARARAAKMLKRPCGYRIIAGSLLNSHNLTDYVPLPAEETAA